MTEEKIETQQQQLKALKSNLMLLKGSKSEQSEEQFYNLMNKAKELLGDLDPQIAQFYYEYANFVLQKIQKNIDIFNTNALPNNTQQEPGLQCINEGYDESEEQPSEIKSQNNCNKPNQTQQILYQGQDNTIAETNNKNTQDKNQQNSNNKQTVKKSIQVENHSKPTQNQPDNINSVDQPDHQQDERQICYINLQCALNIYLKQIDKLQQGQFSPFSFAELSNYISKVRSRLGDLYVINEQYPKAIQEYSCVVAKQQLIGGHESKRALAEIHYLIGNVYVYENKQGCQILAIDEYMIAVKILVQHMHVHYDYDITDIELPSKQQLKVNRFGYLPKPLDKKQVVQIKDVLSCLLDRIEDTHEQIAIRGKYQDEKKKMQQQQQLNTFKAPSKDIKVVHLGSFGNRKKEQMSPTSQSKGVIDQNNTSNHSQDKKKQDKNNSTIQQQQKQQ